MGDVTEGPAVAHEDRARAHRLEEGLVEVDGDGVRALDPVEEVAPAGGGEEPAAVGGVDVQPHGVLGAQVADGAKGVDGAEVGRARGGDDRHGDVAPFAHRLEGEPERVREHPATGGRGDGDDRIGLQAHDPRGREDAEVALVRREHPQPGRGLPAVAPQGLAASQDEALEVGLGAATREDAVRLRAEADPLGGPADEALLDEGPAGALVPGVDGGVHRREEALGEDRGQGDRAVEVGDVGGVVEPDRVPEVEVGHLGERRLEVGGRVVEVHGLHRGGEVGDGGSGRGRSGREVPGDEIGHPGHAVDVGVGGVVGQEVLVQRGDSLNLGLPQFGMAALT